MSLLKEPLFIGMCLSVTLMSVGCPYMLYFLPAYAIQAGNKLIQSAFHLSQSIHQLHSCYSGFTKKEAGMLVAVSAALDLVGRLGLGYLSDLQIFDRKKAFIVW